MHIRTLTFLDKILIRWGIQTLNYKVYVQLMQRALDAEHYFNYGWTSKDC